MAAYEHPVKSYNVRDLLDDIASADPPAYLRRCFAEGCSAPLLSWSRVQQLAVCAKLRDTASQALRRVLERERPEDPDAAAELEQLAGTVAAA